MIALIAAVAIVVALVIGAWWLGRGLSPNDNPTREHPDIWGAP